MNFTTLISCFVNVSAIAVAFLGTISVCR